MTLCSVPVSSIPVTLSFQHNGSVVGMYQLHCTGDCCWLGSGWPWLPLPRLKVGQTKTHSGISLSESWTATECHKSPIRFKSIISYRISCWRLARWSDIKHHLPPRWPKLSKLFRPEPEKISLLSLPPLKIWIHHSFRKFDAPGFVHYFYAIAKQSTNITNICPTNTMTFLPSFLLIALWGCLSIAAPGSSVFNGTSPAQGQVPFQVDPAVASYKLKDNYTASNFFQSFWFFTANDPTHGFVDYVNEADAWSRKLINTNGGRIYMGVDNTTKK